jgi:hypothetical protein
MGAQRSRRLATAFGLAGRVDVYHAFLLVITSVLKKDGVAGVIVSNRFMSTRSGDGVRRHLRESCAVLHVWDFGDTRLFDAAVLPAVILLRGEPDEDAAITRFTTIYETRGPASARVEDPIEAAEQEGIVEVKDGRHFSVTTGTLSTTGDAGMVWRIATQTRDRWLARVDSHTFARLRDIGRVRVGVKTCADSVFIRDDWEQCCESGPPELLRPVTTHHVARRFRAFESGRRKLIVYPHESVAGIRRAVDLSAYPRTRAYLEQHRSALEGRTYVLEAGRNWYEIWVPQDPAAWDRTKLVFRDIAESPVFWIDRTGSVVNGDCYWLACETEQDGDLLWLAAAVANSRFIETFYDSRFNNKLYAGRRRFITQYVEEFPIPDPSTQVARRLIERAKAFYEIAGSESGGCVDDEFETLVESAFGLS